MKRSFVRHLCHELRTPLNVMHLGLESLQKRLPGGISGSIGWLLVDIRESCGEAVEILNNLLSFDKIEGAELLLEKEEISFPSMWSEVTSAFFLKVSDLSIWTVGFLPLMTTCLCLDRRISSG